MKQYNVSIGKSNRSVRARLRELVEQRAAQQPHHLDGRAWAAEPQDWYCGQLGVSPATLRRAIAGPPFVRTTRRVDGRNVTLLRVGDPAPKSARDYVNIMRAIWRRRTRRQLGAREAGCLYGLVGAWPEGETPKLLALVLDDWPEFMAGVKAAAPEAGDRYLRYPSLALVRRYPQVAVEMQLMRDQAGGKL